MDERNSDIELQKCIDNLDKLPNVNLNERLTWEEIIAKYPRQWLGLSDVKYVDDDGITIESAIVAFVGRGRKDVELLQALGITIARYTGIDEIGEVLCMSKNIDELRHECNKVKAKVVSSEPIRTEKDGIVFFEKPQKVNLIEFAGKHPGCNMLTKVIPNDGYNVYIAAYSKSANDNENLIEIAGEQKGWNICVNCFEEEKEGVSYL